MSFKANRNSSTIKTTNRKPKNSFITSPSQNKNKQSSRIHKMTVVRRNQNRQMKVLIISNGTTNIELWMSYNVFCIFCTVSFLGIIISLSFQFLNASMDILTFILILSFETLLIVAICSLQLRAKNIFERFFQLQQISQIEQTCQKQKKFKRNTFKTEPLKKNEKQNCHNKQNTFDQNSVKYNKLLFQKLFFKIIFILNSLMNYSILCWFIINLTYLAKIQTMTVIIDAVAVFFCQISQIYHLVRFCYLNKVLAKEFFNIQKKLAEVHCRKKQLIQFETQGSKENQLEEYNKFRNIVSQQICQQIVVREEKKQVFGEKLINQISQDILMKPLKGNLKKINEGVKKIKQKSQGQKSYNVRFYQQQKQQPSLTIRDPQIW